MSILLEKFYGELGWKVDTKGPAQFEKQKTGIVAGFAKIGAAYTAIAGMVTGFVAHTNAETAATYRLAKSTNVSYDVLKRWGSTTKGVGIGAEGAAQAITFLNRNIGNVAINPGQAAGVNAALKSIGLNLKDVSGMGTEERFNTIVSALGNVDDQATVTAASFKLFGRGGGASFARLAQLAKSQGKTIDEYVGRWKDLEFETDQSVKGAVDFTASMGAIKFAVSEVKATIAGYIGEALVPMLKGAREWISNNRELIRSKLAEWARGTVTWLKGVWRFVELIGRGIGPLVSAFGGLGNVLKLSAIGYLAVKLAAATKGVNDLTLGFNALTRTQIKGFFTGPGGVAGLAGVAMLALSDLWDSLQDISNNSWGNRIARQMLNLSDRTTIWVAEMAGLYFKSDADRAGYIAASMNYTAQLLNDSLANIGIFFENIQNKIASFLVWLGVLKAVPKQYQEKKYQNTRQESVKQMAYYGGGKYLSEMKKSYQNAGAQTINAPITVNPSPGMDEKKLAGHVAKELERTMKRAVRTAKAAESI